MPRKPQQHKPPRSHAAPSQDREKTADRGYDGVWRKLRAAYLATNPSCAMCLELGIARPATVVDHVVAHKGDERLRLDEANLQSLCASCHGKKTCAQDGAFGRAPTAPAPRARPKPRAEPTAGQSWI
jgi:5-methylcytosine-specific restriction protein A